MKSIRQFGEEVVTDLCRRLLDLGAPGIHFYTLNRAQASLKLCRNLGLGAGNENPKDTAAA
jgi:methylenetetrahydrofolate reductase (NADPH)